MTSLSGVSFRIVTTRGSCDGEVSHGVKKFQGNSSPSVHGPPTHERNEHLVRQVLRAQDDNVQLFEQEVPVLKGKTKKHMYNV